MSDACVDCAGSQTDGDGPLLAVEARTGGDAGKSALGARRAVVAAALLAVGAVGLLGLRREHHRLVPASLSALSQKTKYPALFAYGYEDLGKGKCLKEDGSKPEETEHGVKIVLAETMCDQDAACKGFTVKDTTCARGAIMFKAKAGTVKGGGEDYRGGHCFKKLEDVKYETQEGYGKCITADGSTPKFERVESGDEFDIRMRCTKDKSCMGYSAAWSGTHGRVGGYLWKETGLRGGGESWQVCRCTVKVDARAPAAAEDKTKEETVYQSTGGRGKCLTEDGKSPEHKWVSDGDVKVLQDRCNKEPRCKGYSASAWGGGLIWLTTGKLKGGGGQWAMCSCVVKTTRTVAVAPPEVKPKTTAAPKPEPVKKGEYKAVGGSGKCLTADGGNPEHLYTGGKEAALQKKCDENPKCKGYSASTYGGGLLWLTEKKLKGGGRQWGRCKCMVKS